MPLLAKHTYWSYLGRTCSLCKQGCLLHEPALLTCTGSNCSGAKVRKVASPCIARTWADNFASNAIQKRRTMTKSWNICWYALCAWRVCTKFVPSSTSIMTLNPITCAPLLWDEMWTSKKGDRTHCKEDEVGWFVNFLCGTDIELNDVTDSATLSLDNVPETPLSSLIEEKVRECNQTRDYPNAGKTVNDCIISNCSKFFKFPEVV